MAAPWRTQNNFYRKHLYNVMQLYRGRPDLQMFTEILLSLSAVIIFGILAIRPTFVTIATLIQEIKAKEEVVVQLDEKVQNLSIAQQVYQQNDAAISLLTASIPQKPMPHYFIRQLEALIAKNSITLNTIIFEHINLRGEALSANTTQSGTDALLTLSDTASKIDFSVTVAGTYSNLANFVKDFENLLMVSIADKNDMSLTEDSTILTLTIFGRIPYSKTQ